MKVRQPVSISLLSDCLGILPLFGSGSFSLAIEDPEYGIGESRKNHLSRNTPVPQRNGRTLIARPANYIRQEWDNDIPPDEYFFQVRRVSRNTIMFGANYFPQIVGTAFKPPRRNEFQKFLDDYPTGWILWDKLNGDNDFSDCEVIYTTFDFPSFVLPYLWAGMLQGKSIEEPDVQQGNKKLNERRLQPGHKPVILYRYLMERFTVPGDTVLDTHSGSGSSRIAAWETGLDYVGIEKEKDNWDRQQYRFNQHVKNIQIFRGY